MKVYTGQMSKAKKKNGFIDITIKSGMKEFAPTWDMVMGHKNGKITDEEYTKKYYELMKISWKNNKDKWLEILHRDEVVKIGGAEASINKIHEMFGVRMELKEERGNQCVFEEVYYH